MFANKLILLLTVSFTLQIACSQTLSEPVIIGQNGIGPTNFKQNILPISGANRVNFGSNGLNLGVANAYNSFNLGTNGVNLGSNNVNLGSNSVNLGSNVVNGAAGVVNLGTSLNNLGLGYNSGPFTILSGSPAYDYPNGVQISSDAIEVGGQVAVNGAVPFYGAVAMDGDVSVGGQAGVSYAAGPGVSLNGGGLGSGLGGGNLGVSISNLGVNGRGISSAASLGGVASNGFGNILPSLARPGCGN